MMRVLTPTTLADALAMRADEPQATPVAGGTDVYVCWPERVEAHRAAHLDLWNVDGLRGVRWCDDYLELGALATYWDVLMDASCGREFRLLHDAAEQVGAVQIQTRGTWAGNIANGSPAADGVPVLMAYDARVVLASTNGEREVPLDELYRGYKTLDVRDDELIVAVRVPRRAHDVEVFEKVGSRRAQAITKVGVAVTRSAEGWRVVANSVAPTVVRCRTLEAWLERDETPADVGEVLAALQDDVAPIDDLRSTAAYRREVLARLLAHFLAHV